MNSTETDQPRPSGESLFQLSFDEKLKIAIQTLITGQLKDNHDDTLFEKLCSLLESEIESDHLVQFVIQENIFSLIDANLPDFENANSISKHKNDFVASFRIIGSLFSNEEVFKLYLTCEEDVFNVGDLLIRTFVLANDQSHDSKLLIFSLLTLMKSISSHKSGAKYFLSLWFKESTNKTENNFALNFIEFVKQDNTHYIQKELYSILCKLIDFSISSPLPLCKKFCSNIRKYLLDDLNFFHCKLLIDMLRFISDKRLFVSEFNLIEKILYFFKQTHSMSEDELNYLTKLISRLLSLFAEDLTAIVELLEFTIIKLHSSNDFFPLITFLTLNVNLDYSIREFGSIHDLWFRYMEKMLSLVHNHHYSNIDQIEPHIANRDYLVEQAFNSMSYQSFELKCFRILNQIDVNLLQSGDIQFLVRHLKSIIIKLTNRKNTIFVLTFLDQAIKLKSKDATVLAEVLSTYCNILCELPLHRGLILKSLRNFFICDSNLIYSEVVFLRICDILHFFNRYMKEVEHFEDNEIVDIITETVLHLVLYIDFEQIYIRFSDICQQFNNALQQIFQIEHSYLESISLESSIRANIVTSLYCISRYSLSSKNIPISVTKVSFELLFSSADYDSLFRQTLYFNMNNILKHSIPICIDECRFLLPLFCKLCIEENDTELECLLILMIELICKTYFHSTTDVSQCVDFFLKSGLFTLIYTLLKEPLILYRTKLATLSLHSNICMTLTTQLANVDFEPNFDFIAPTKAASLQDAFKFCLSPNEDLRKSIEKQRDCPSVSILDDIISTSLITEDMVMDCY